MLKNDQITKLESLLKLPAGTLATAIKDEKEVDITIPEVSVFTAEEITKRDENIKTSSYKEGKGAATEMLVKEYREKLGLDFEGKEPDKLIDAIQKKALSDAKIEPNKTIEEQKKVIEQLKTNVQTFETQKKDLEGKILQSQRDSKLLGLFPSGRLPLLKDDEYLSIIKNEVEITEEDGKMVAKKAGQVLRNATTQDPLDVKDVIGSIFNDRKWIGEEDPARKGRGAGGDSGKGGAVLKLSELTKKWEADGKSTQGLDFSAAVEAAQKENPSFDMNS